MDSGDIRTRVSICASGVFFSLMLAGLCGTRVRSRQRVVSAGFVIVSFLLLLANVRADTLSSELNQILAIETNLENGKKQFAQCTRCHGTEGWGAYNGDYPQIAGQHASVVIKQIIDIHAGRRENPAMLSAVNELIKQGAQGLADVAAYTALLKMNPDPGVGEFEDSELTQEAEIFERICSTCHGQKGEGNAKSVIPLLQGQNFAYLLRQLKRIQAGTRKNANPEMRELISGLSEQQMEKMATYISRLEPPEERLAPYDWVNPDFE